MNTEINPIICYNLSKIPGFNDITNNSSILKLNNHSCKTSNNQTYTVVRYDKNYLTSDLIPVYGLCRSVILNSDNEVISFSPPKSIPADIFINKYCEKNDVVAEEFIEGTMINVFWDKKIGLNGAWEISTRNTVGGLSGFYKYENSKTFREMFLEAAKANNLVLEKLNMNYCYSFVLQHPENRIVVPFNKPQIYLVGMYSISNMSSNEILVYSYDMDYIKRFYWGDAKIRFPETYTFNKYSDLIDKYASMNTSYNVLGVILKNKITGERTKIRNPVYEQIKILKGNQPKLQYQYLSLRKEGKVKEYLNYYPENKKDFSTFRDQLHLFTETLYTNYVSCYIKKEKTLINYSDQYRTHMFHIHKIYIDKLMQHKQFVTKNTVISYVNDLHPSLLMYCLNYTMRKRNIDFIKAEIEE
jgi:hypothetical protein